MLSGEKLPRLIDEKLCRGAKYFSRNLLQKLFSLFLKVAILNVYIGIFQPFCAVIIPVTRISDDRRLIYLVLTHLGDEESILYKFITN